MFFCNARTTERADIVRVSAQSLPDYWSHDRPPSPRGPLLAPGVLICARALSRGPAPDCAHRGGSVVGSEGPTAGRQGPVPSPFSGRRDAFHPPTPPTPSIFYRGPLAMCSLTYRSCRPLPPQAFLTSVFFPPLWSLKLSLPFPFYLSIYLSISLHFCFLLSALCLFLLLSIHCFPLFSYLSFPLPLPPPLL